MTHGRTLFDNKTVSKTDCILNKNDLTFRECVLLTSFKIEMEKIKTNAQHVTQVWS